MTPDEIREAFDRVEQAYQDVELLVSAADKNGRVRERNNATQRRSAASVEGSENDHRVHRKAINWLKKRRADIRLKKDCAEALFKRFRLELSTARGHVGEFDQVMAWLDVDRDAQPSPAVCAAVLVAKLGIKEPIAPAYLAAHEGLVRPEPAAPKKRKWHKSAGLADAILHL